MARRIGPGGLRIMVEPQDTSAYVIAQQFTGDGLRWPELVAANPDKPRNIAATFRTLTPGETLCLPSTWVDCADAKGIAIDEAADAAGLGQTDEAGAALPYGWSSEDAKIASALADLWNVGVDAVLVTMFEESGLQPHNVTKYGDGKAPDGGPNYKYAGLIAGLAETWLNGKRVYPIDQSFGWPAGTWETIVTQTPIATQMQAIAQIWDRQFKTYIPGKMSVRQYADRMGVSPAAVIHAVNFLPARMGGLQNADSPITRAGEQGGFYEGNAGPNFPNWGLDVNRDGAISLRDLDLHGQQKLAELEKSNLGPILAEARGSKPPEALAALFAPIRSQWQSITGKPIVTTVGWNEPPAAAKGGGAVVLLLLAGAAALWHFTKKG